MSVKRQVIEPIGATHGNRTGELADYEWYGHHGGGAFTRKSGGARTGPRRSSGERPPHQLLFPLVDVYRFESLA